MNFTYVSYLKDCYIYRNLRIQTKSKSLPMPCVIFKKKIDWSKTILIPKYFWKAKSNLDKYILTMWLDYQQIILSRYSSFLRRPYWMFKQNQVGLRYCLLRSLDYTTAIMVVAEIRLMLRRQDNCGLPFFNDNLLSKLIRSTWLPKFVFTLKRRQIPPLPP